MELITNNAQMKKFCADQNKILIPTMGAIHAGHLSLIDKAKTLINPQKNDYKILVSIFVNPLQMGSIKNFNEYPRSLEVDCQKLANKGVDAVFAPSVDEIYPKKQEFLIKPVGKLSTTLEGDHRRLHFQGVATVLTKLFNIITPQYVILGQKDYQQMLIVKQMVKELNYNISIISAPTKRDKNGLALSSRNMMLSKTQLKEAPRMFKVLQDMRKKIHHTQKDLSTIEQEALAELNKSGWQTDYVAIRNVDNLAKPVVANSKKSLIALIAAKLGNIRLIDNLIID